MFWPSRQVAITGETYADITWIAGEQITEQAILDKYLEYTIHEAVAYIRQEARAKRNEAHRLVLGTDDSNLIRLYQEKVYAADAYVANIAGATIKTYQEDMLVNEAQGLGLTAEYLAGAILHQSLLGNTQLLPILGEIESIRRERIYYIEQSTTVEQALTLRNATISWPDLSGLFII